MRPKERTIKRILVGTDFSRPASNAVQRAAMLAAEHSAALEIVHVMPRIGRALLAQLGLGGSVWASVDAQLEAYLADAERLARMQGVDAGVKRLKGAASTMLAREAARMSADIVVLGYRGERSSRDEIIGTTAERFLERWTGDTLVVRNAPRGPYETILACVALAPVSDSVVMSAVALSKQARLHILHAYGPPFETRLIRSDVAPEALSKYREKAKENAKQGVAALLSRCAVPKDRRVTQHLRHGSPSTEIQRAADRHRSEVVVVGKNLSLMEELFLGSVTKKVIRAAHADILVSDPR